MFEAQVAYYLNRYLGRYVEGIDQKSLAISIYAGNVVLHNLQLKASALAELDLPVTVKAGLLGSLTLKVPWNALGRTPVEVFVDQLYIIAEPKASSDDSATTPTRQGEEEESEDRDHSKDDDMALEKDAGGSSPASKKVPISAADVQAAYHKNKIQKVKKQESRWLNELDALETRRQEVEARRGARDDEDTSNKGGGFLRNLIDVIVGNLQLSIQNVHIRYEDATTHPNHPFACGFFLEQISASTVDEQGNQTFVTQSPLDIIRKSLKLRGMAIYFNCDETAWDPGQSWKDVPPSVWNQWFRPARTQEGGKRHRMDFILRPVDGRAYYVRRGNNVSRSEDEPSSDFDLSLDRVALALNRQQYQSYSLLLAQFSLYSARLPYSGYRPAVRPVTKASARAWWKFAVLAVRQQLENRRLTWTQIVRYLEMRRRYVPLYVDHLKRARDPQAGDDGSKAPTSYGKDSLPTEIAKMDEVLPEVTIIMFRRLSYAEYQRDLRRKRRRNATDAGTTKPSGASKGSTAGGWLSWLTGGGARAEDQKFTETVEVSPAEEETRLDQRADLNAEEYDQLVEWVSQQEEGLKLGVETPYSLITRVRIAVSAAAAVLEDADSETKDGVDSICNRVSLLRGSLMGISAGVEMYPSTRKVQIAVVTMGIESPEGMFVQTGAMTSQSDEDTGSSHTFDRMSSIVREVRGLSSSHALDLMVVQSPQDNAADLIVSGALTPSYVDYSAEVISRVTEFFMPPVELKVADFESLGAAASSRLEQARRLATEYANVALSSRPKLLMKLVLHAPKIAVPVHDPHNGDATLAIDLGRFVIESDYDTVRSLSNEEAALYECIKLTGSNVSAFVVDQKFSWRQLEEDDIDSRLAVPGFVPLIERCGWEINAQAARFFKPEFPRLRLQAVIPSLRFHLSPGRFGRLMRIINGAIPQSREETKTEAAIEGEQNVLPKSSTWRERSDKEGPIFVLSWSRFNRTSATWNPYFASLYQGSIYMLESPAVESSIAATISVWPNRRTLEVPPEVIRGYENVLAIVPESSSFENIRTVIDDPSNYLLRFRTSEELVQWRNSIESSQALLQGLSNKDTITSLDNISDWESASAISSSDHEDYKSVSIGEEKPSMETYRSPVVQFDAKLGEFAVYASGREPLAWWPADEISAMREEESGDRSEKSDISESSSEVPSESEDVATTRVLNRNIVEQVDHEVSLIIMRASGSYMNLRYGNSGLDIKMSLKSFEIQDQLVGKKNPHQCFLASSAVLGVEAIQVGDDVFFDAARTSSRDIMLSGSSFSSRSSEHLATPRAGEHERQQQDLAEFVFSMRNPDAPEYAGVDTLLEISFNTLYFYCNRPTVAALMTLGVDLGEAVSSELSSERDPSTKSKIGSDGDINPEMPHDGQDMHSESQTSKKERDNAEGSLSSALEDFVAANQKETFTLIPSSEDEVEPMSEDMDQAVATTEFKRKSFALNVKLSSLSAILNYEGDDNTALAEASMDDLSFKLSFDLSGNMDVDSALGSINVTDRTLPEDHPYRNTCATRSDKGTDLISIKLASHSASSAHARAPSGVPFYTVQATLNQVRTILLYRFLQENLRYLQTMLAMRLASSRGAEGLDESTMETEDRTTSERDPSLEVSTSSRQIDTHPSFHSARDRIDEQQQEGEKGEIRQGSGDGSVPVEETSPFAIVMDIEMNAPVIQLPASSSSRDAVEIDLGRLHLTSRVDRVTSSESESHVLIETADLTFTGVLCSVLHGGRKGSSLIRNPEEGWRVQWQRALDPANRGSKPMMDVSLQVPFIKASLSDVEYRLLTSAVGSNFNEEPNLPLGVRWIESQHAADDSTAVRKPTSHDVVSVEDDGQGARTLQAETDTHHVQQGQKAFDDNTPQVAPSREEISSRTSIRVSVDLNEVELELQHSVKGLSDPSPLARLSVLGLFVSYRNSEIGSMQLDAFVPRIEVQDCRSHVPIEQSLVVSSGHKASFLMLMFKAGPAMACQTLDIILQKPLLVAEISFLMDIVHFYVPNVLMPTNSTIPFNTYDIVLRECNYQASEDLYLSPYARLLADTPGICSYEYHGNGHKIILPPRQDLDAMLPLIILGPGRTLRLKNVTVVNPDSLPACLQLAPSSKLLMDPGDDVKLTSSHVTYGASQAAEDFRNPGESPEAKVESMVNKDETQSGDAARSQLNLNFSAAGLGLHFVKLLESEGLEDHTPRDRQHLKSLASSSWPEIHSRKSSSELSEHYDMERVSKTRSAHILAAKMDIEASYESCGAIQSGKVSVQGLSLESRTVHDVGHAFREREKKLLAERRKDEVRGKFESRILYPCFLNASFKIEGGAEENMIKASVELNTSDLSFILSPRTLELGIELASQALEPLRRPGHDQALYAISQYELVWSFDRTARTRDDESAIDVSAGLETGLSAWRPLPPMGYGITGHILTPGKTDPNFEVFVVALNSGIASYPVSFTKVWTGDGMTVWRPRAPRGYRAVGDLIKLEENGQPHVDEILCIHESVAVEAAIGQYFSISTAVQPHSSPAQSNKTPSMSVDLWCIDNCFGTFVAASSQSNMFEGRGWDLRSPIGMTPASLVAAGTATFITNSTTKPADDEEKPSFEAPELRLTSTSYQLYDKYLRSRRSQRREEIHRTLTPKIVDFRRIWSDGGTFTNGVGLTAWRPVAPTGYASLGDCLVRGFDPPASVLVVSDNGLLGSTEDVSSRGTGTARASRRDIQPNAPLVKSPRGFELLWHDGNPRVEFRASFWKPIPPPGYVALGCVASIGEDPPRRAVKCIRADAVVPSSYARARTPLWAIRRSDQTLPALSVWLADEHLHTFLVQPNDTMRPPDDMWQLKSFQEEEESIGEPSHHHAAAEGQGVSVVTKLGNVAVMLLDSFNIPLVKFNTFSIEAGLRGPSQHVMQGYLGVRPSLSAYNRQLSLWEPMIEATDLIVKCDANLGLLSDGAIEPGIQITMKTSTEMVFTTAATSHISALLGAANEYRQTYGRHRGWRRQAYAYDSELGGDESIIETYVVNCLGVDAAMEVDFGGKMQSKVLRAGDATRILRPLMQRPSEDATHHLPLEALPHDLILLDMNKLVGDHGVENKRIFCTVCLEDQQQGSGSGMEVEESHGAARRLHVLNPRTRPLHPTKIHADKSDEDRLYQISWSERLVIMLPHGSESVSLSISIVDCEAKGGVGEILATGSVVMDPLKLEDRELYPVDIELERSAGKSSGHVWTLDFVYSVQHQWRASVDRQRTKSSQRRGRAFENVQRATNIGERALSIANEPDTWTVVPMFARQRPSPATDSALLGSEAGELVSMTSLSLGERNFIMEAGFRDGKWMELLRAPCQVVNDSNFVLEVGLLEVNPDAGADTARKDHSTSRNVSSADTDASQTTMDIIRVGTAKPGDSLPLPLGWNAASRRLIIRPTVYDSGDASRESTSSNKTGEITAYGSSSHDQDASSSMHVVHDWSRMVTPSQEQIGLSLTNLIDQNSSFTTLFWCPLGTKGRHKFIEKEFPSPFQSQQAKSTNFEGSEEHPENLDNALWFSVAVEASQVSSGLWSHMDLDWKIAIGPPIRLVNHLPFPGSFMVWERTAGEQYRTSEVVGRLVRHVESGGEIAVHTADVRNPISLTFYPDGYEWMETGPVLISGGLAGASPVVDRCRIGRPGSGLSLEVFMRRDFQLGRWLLSDTRRTTHLYNRSKDKGNTSSRGNFKYEELLVKGVPVSLTFLVPLWVVNDSNLTIEALVVDEEGMMMMTKSKKSFKTGASFAKKHISRQSAKDPSEKSSHVSRIWTSDVQSPGDNREWMQAIGQRSIPPSSMELLSYPLPTFSSNEKDVSFTMAERKSQPSEHYGVRLRVAGSGWTPPLALSTIDTARDTRHDGSTKSKSNVDSIQNALPAVIRAESKEYGFTFGIAARLELSPFTSCYVLRLEPEVVVSNRTPIPMQLLQCLTEEKLSESSFGPLGQGQSSSSSSTLKAVVPRGGMLATTAKILEYNPEGKIPVMRPDIGHMNETNVLTGKGPSDEISRQINSGTVGIRRQDSRQSAPDDGHVSTRWERSSIFLSASSMIEMSAHARKDNLSLGCAVTLSPGAAAIPLHCPMEVGGIYHTICIRCVDSDKTEETDSSFWSRPLAISAYDDEERIVIAPLVPGHNAHRFMTSSRSDLSGIALVRISVHARGPGVQHVVIESAAADPPFLIENRSPLSLAYRQARVDEAQYSRLGPLSADGYCWEYSIANGAPSELQLKDAAVEGKDVDVSRLYKLEIAEDSNAAISMSSPYLPVSDSSRVFSIRVGYVETVATGLTGIIPIGGDTVGGSLGRGGIDRVLQIGPGKDPILLAGLKGKSSPPPDIIINVEIPGLEVSIVDNVPQEVLLVTLNDFSLRFAKESTPLGLARSVRLQLQSLQVDNQLPGVRYPVFLCPSKTAERDLPMLRFSVVEQLPDTRGRTFFPFIGIRSPQEIQLSVSEPAIWRLMEVISQLHLSSDASAADDAHPSRQTAADVPVRIRLLTLPDVNLNVSFQGDPLSRPRHKITGLISYVIDLANFQGASVTLHGFDWSEIRTMRSTFVAELWQAIQGELLGLIVSLVRNFGVIGGASRIFGILSAGVANLTGDRHVPSNSEALGRSMAQGRGEIADVGEGLIEGAGAFGNSVLRGIRGLVEKPLSGAKSSGVEGAMKGVAKGIVGVVTNPISGVLDALSATAEGFDASFGRSMDNVVLQRRRLARLVGADTLVQPIVRDGSTRQSTVEQLGQALLWNTLMASPDEMMLKSTRTNNGSGRVSNAKSELGNTAFENYVEHFVLPDDFICLLTSERILYLYCRGFVNLEAAGEIGAIYTAPQKVPHGAILWSVAYDDVLAMELRWSSRDAHHPDRLIVHRCGLSQETTTTQEKPKPLALLLPCFPDTPQATQMKLVISSVLERALQESVKADQRWSERHKARASLTEEQSIQDLPFWLPSLCFEHKWNTNPNRPPVVHFWHPTAPPGYKPVGDVATLDEQQPLHPVPCFRDDIVLKTFDPRKGDRAQSSPEEERPATCPPAEFSLIWRYQGRRTVSVWMPVPPEGYVAMGAIVLGEAKVPNTEDYVCIRDDLTLETRVFNSPIWSYDPELPIYGVGAQSGGGMERLALQPERWKITVWPVDSQTGTFIAVRGKHQPPPGIARTVKILEELQAGKQ